MAVRRHSWCNNWAVSWVVQGLNPAGASVFLLSVASRVAVGPTQPPVQWVKCPAHEAGHSPFPITDVTNEQRTACVLSWHGQGQLYIGLTLQCEITVYKEPKVKLLYSCSF
jgi:hypothetical protein